MERESDNKISFLDLNVSKNQTENMTKLNSSIFRNKTLTGVGMNFHRCTYFKFKINNIKTFIHRAYTLYPTWTSFNSEVEFLSRYFCRNSYPSHIFYNVLRKFLDSKLLARKSKCCQSSETYYVFQVTIFKQSIMSFFRKNSLTHLTNFTLINFKIVFTNNFTIHGFLNHQKELPRIGARV